MQRAVRRQAQGRGTSAGRAIVEHCDVRVLRCGAGQNLALAAAQIPSGDDRIDHIYRYGKERSETICADWSWPPGNLGQYPAGDNQLVAKAYEQIELAQPVEDDER